MVTVIGAQSAENRDGGTYYKLVIEGGVRTVISSETGLPYLTSQKMAIPTTFSKEQCEGMVGKRLDGEIEKVPCEPYEITVNGETQMRDFRYVYQPDGVNYHMDVV